MVLTYVERVVVSTETVDDRLFRSRLVFDHPVWLTILGNRLGRRWTCNSLGELVTSCLRTDIERRALKWCSRESVSAESYDVRRNGEILTKSRA